MQKDLRARVSAGTAIFRGERILLLHRSIQASSPGIWDLPGGHVENSETLSNAAKRETREETGFEVRLGSVFHVDVFSTLSKRGKLRQTVGVFYHCTAPARKPPRLDADEHSEYAWVSLAELNSYPTAPFVDRAIRAAFRTRAEPFQSRTAPGAVRYSLSSEPTSSASA
jgi:8-oxo-dGTP diphosphatase